MSKVVLWYCLSVLAWDFFTTSPADSALVRSSIQMGQRLGTEVVTLSKLAYRNFPQEWHRAGQDFADARDRAAAFFSQLRFAKKEDASQDRASPPLGTDQAEGSPIQSDGHMRPDPSRPKQHAELNGAITDQAVALGDAKILTRAPKRLRPIIRHASSRTGVSTYYLVKTAERESRFNTKARAFTSSAAGLFQFIDQTWLGLVDRYGHKHGLLKEARAIGRNSSGVYVFRDTSQRRHIMNLRYDARISTLMAAELATENRRRLTRSLRRDITDSELYIAHFLGADGAIKLIRTANRAPKASAVKAFPKAARANRSIFYARNGKHRTVAQVVDRLHLRHETKASMEQVFAFVARVFHNLTGERGSRSDKPVLER